MFVPVNISNSHWFAFAVRLDEQIIEVFDSYAHRRGDGIAFYEEFAQPLCAFLNRFERHAGRHLQAGTHWLRLGNAPKQRDAFSCGVHTCMCGRHVVLGMPLQGLDDAGASGPLRKVMSWFIGFISS